MRHINEMPNKIVQQFSFLRTVIQSYFKTRLDFLSFALTLTVLMEANEVQRVRSTLSHTPDRLQVLLIMVVVVGQWRVQMVSASVSGQDRNSVVSASHLPVAA